MAKISDPFDQEHDDATDPEAQRIDALDPAQKSLADALRVSFLILKVIMLILVVYYAFSGVFSVGENEKAVLLRRGQIVPGGYASGGPYFALPYPLDEVVKISGASRTIQLPTQFWFEPDFRASAATGGEVQGKPGPLDPIKDGYLVTGDTNVVHVKAAVTYEIDDAALYTTNIGDSAERSEEIVRSAAEQAIVRAAAQFTADDLIREPAHAELAREYAQGILNTLDSGIKVTNVSLTERVIPSSVYRFYTSVTDAEADKAKAIDRAERERERILGDTAGGGHERLWAMITSYERAVAMADQQAIKQLGTQLDEAFKTLTIGDADAPAIISGKVATVINDAMAYRTQVVEQVKAEAETFQRLLPKYLENPRIVAGRMWQEAKEVVLTGNAVNAASMTAGQLPGLVETIYVPPGFQLYIRTNRDPQVAKQNEEFRLQVREQEARQPK